TPVEKRRVVDLEGLARRVCAAKAGASRPAIPVATPAVPAAALGHEDRLEHVIAHLVQNALDATAAGGEVDVRIGREGASPSARCAIRVRV
ncbi:MAG: PEP-CTERM system histidine kinase PrsK, partial [Betaproteobacteria bacterium]